MTSKIKTRSATDHFLIGSEQAAIKAGSQILTPRAMLQYVMFRKNSQDLKKWKIQDVICCPMLTGTRYAVCQVEGSSGCLGGTKCVVAAVKDDGHWIKSGIPLITDLAIKEKIIKLHKLYREKMMKHKGKQNSKSVDERLSFSESVDNIFDIAAPNAEDLIQKDKLRPPEDKADDIAFLKDQRQKDRKGTLGENDERYKAAFQNKRNTCKGY